MWGKTGQSFWPRTPKRPLRSRHLSPRKTSGTSNGKVPPALWPSSETGPQRGGIGERGRTFHSTVSDTYCGEALNGRDAP